MTYPWIDKSLFHVFDKDGDCQASARRVEWLISGVCARNMEWFIVRGAYDDGPENAEMIGWRFANEELLEHVADARLRETPEVESVSLVDYCKNNDAQFAIYGWKWKRFDDNGAWDGYLYFSPDYLVVNGDGWSKGYINQQSNRWVLAHTQPLESGSDEPD